MRVHTTILKGRNGRVATVGRTAGTGGIAGVQGPAGKAWCPPRADVRDDTEIRILYLRRRSPAPEDTPACYRSQGLTAFGVALTLDREPPD